MNENHLKDTPERRALFNALVAPMAGGPVSPEDATKMLDTLVAAAMRAQAQMDAELMQKMSDRSPTTKPPKGGTNSRTVFAEAARILDPDELGWSLSLPDHLRHEVSGES